MGSPMRCAHCGSDLLDDSIYCMVCGNKVGDEQKDVVSYADLPFGTILACPKCGGKNSRTDRWCRFCDADLDDAKKRYVSLTPSGSDCRVCGISSPAGSQYCRKCGASLKTGLRRGATESKLSIALGDSGPTFPFPVLGDSQPAHQHEIVRERQVIMIRCRYCGTLNGPTAQKCSSCGAQM